MTVKWGGMARADHDIGPFVNVDVDEIMGSRPLITVAKAWQSSTAERLVDVSRKLDSAKRAEGRALRDLAESRVERERLVGDLNAQVARLEEKVQAAETRLREMHRASVAAVLVAWLGALLLSLGANLLTQDPKSLLAALMLALGVVAEIAAWFVRGPRSSQEP